MPPPLTAHIQPVELARTRWMTAGAERTLGCTTGNGEQPGLQQESLKGKEKALRKKKILAYWDLQQEVLLSSRELSLLEKTWKGNENSCTGEPLHNTPVRPRCFCLLQNPPT